jgi:hypothetical protein
VEGSFDIKEYHKEDQSLPSASLKYEIEVTGQKREICDVTGGLHITN